MEDSAARPEKLRQRGAELTTGAIEGSHGDFSRRADDAGVVTPGRNVLLFESKTADN